jgi:exodeoxyribonuclease V alpha subunit
MASADAVARSLGASPDLPQRRLAVLANAMQDVLTEGHSCVPIAYLLQRASLTSPDVTDADVAKLAQHRQLVVGAGYAWSPRSDDDERVVAERICALLSAAPTTRVEIADQPAGGLTNEQWEGVKGAFAHGVSIVCGGPGTGKTFMVQAIARIAAAARWQAALCAPTGRAARRITQSTGLEATTVHRLLDWSRGDGPGPARDATQPIDADIVVVDEASMLDTHLAAQLLAAIREGTRLLFVGDPDQLPSVGAGRFLADLIDSGTVPVTRLTVVHRQAQRSQIIRAAHQINSGLLPTGERPDDPDALWDFFWIPEPDPARLVATVTDMVARRLPAHYDLDPLRDILVMAPAKRGPAGVMALNASIASRLNPDGDAIPNSRLRVGDKAMWTANDEELDLANGMMLLIEGFDAASRELYALDEEGRAITLPAQRLRDLQPGFAITAHKSQGGEAAVAITVLHRAETHPGLLTREMLYTSVTRARQVSVVIGDAAAYETCVATVGAQRCTGLVARLRHAG